MADDVVDLTAEESAEGDDALQPFQQVQHVAASPSTAEDHNTLQALDQELRKLVSQREALDRRIEQLSEEKEELLSRVNAKKKKRKREEEEQTDWEKESFAFSPKVRQVLQLVFGLRSFRPQQLTVINASLSSVDCFAVMPTGYGKSLLYQIPALVEEKKLTLVISPLISLSFDQVHNLRSRGISAAMLSAATTKGEYKKITAAMDESTLCLLYVTPEKILKSKRFLAKLEKMYAQHSLARIVIDEAHCCATMGHDFRPDYQKLFILRRQFPKVPLLAVTATATHQVQHEVRRVLLGENSITEDWKVVRLSFNRPNLFYSVVEKPEKGAKVDELILHLIATKFPRQSGIVYVFSRREAESLSLYLSSNGIKAAGYHAYITDTAKSDIHEAWKSGGLDVIVATSAFGMGIDKADVRFVLHHTLPKNMEAYSQESGRAGRDGQQSHCILLYRRADILRVSALLSESARGESQLLQLVRYAEEVKSCRRAVMAQSFGEADTFIPAQHCRSSCDTCSALRGNTKSSTEEDVTDEALAVLRAWEDLAGKSENQRVTMNQLLDTVRGVGKLAKLTEHRCSQGWRKSAVEKLIVHMLLCRVFCIKWVYTAYTTNTYIGKGHNAAALEAKRLAVRFQTGLNSG